MIENVVHKHLPLIGGTKKQQLIHSSLSVLPHNLLWHQKPDPFQIYNFLAPWSHRVENRKQRLFSY